MCFCVDIDKSSFNTAAAAEFRPTKFWMRKLFIQQQKKYWNSFLLVERSWIHKSFSLQIESDHVSEDWAEWAVKDDGTARAGKKSKRNLPHIIIMMKRRAGNWAGRDFGRATTQKVWRDIMGQLMGSVRCSA